MANLITFLNFLDKGVKQIDDDIEYMKLSDDGDKISFDHPGLDIFNKQLRDIKNEKMVISLLIYKMLILIKRPHNDQPINIIFANEIYYQKDLEKHKSEQVEYFKMISDSSNKQGVEAINNMREMLIALDFVDKIETGDQLIKLIKKMENTILSFFNSLSDIDIGKFKNSFNEIYNKSIREDKDFINYFWLFLILYFLGTYYDMQTLINNGNYLQSRNEEDFSISIQLVDPNSEKELDIISINDDNYLIISNDFTFFNNLTLNDKYDIWGFIFYTSALLFKNKNFRLLFENLEYNNYNLFKLWFNYEFILDNEIDVYFKLISNLIALFENFYTSSDKSTPRIQIIVKIFNKLFNLFRYIPALGDDLISLIHFYSKKNIALLNFQSYKSHSKSEDDHLFDLAPLIQ